MIYLNLLNLIIINLFHIHYAQRLTPIIGDKCDINSPEVLIGGKETQFFLKCEQSLQSETDKGVWVVKKSSSINYNICNITNKFYSDTCNCCINSREQATIATIH
ncbi:hypothetical protein LOAG_13614 [Loa loa]|uniref:Uncharacterized protein n=1 Tax=Loa loa TaxID=7209 RepID=A0A1S0TJ80_LOALO|nr:hypothetical protein LOAG_13614 [Loa loa]EFO14901.1 hypothetical protein LOAG_13614 [Loa loa]